MTTRSALAAAADSWLIRDDVAGSADFATLLKMAESRINRLTRTVVQEKSALLTFTSRYADLPANFLEMRQIFIDDTLRKLNYVTPSQLRESSYWNSGRVARYYTIEGGGGTADSDDRMQVVIANAATAASPLEVSILYWARWKTLTNANDTNWLLTNHFDIYLYAVLRAAAEYIQEDEKEVAYETRFKTALDELRLDQSRGRFGATAKQSSGSPRTVV